MHPSWVHKTYMGWQTIIIILKYSCCRLNICPSLNPRFICWKLKPGVMIFGDEAFSVQATEALRNGISALVKENPENSFASFCYLRTQQDGHLWTRKLTRHQVCWCLNLVLPSLKNCEKLISVVYKLLAYGISVTTTPMDWDLLLLQMIQTVTPSF